MVAPLTLAAGTAQAQSGEDGRARRSRVGLELGVGLQLGEISCRSEGDFCDDFTEAVGLNLNAAYCFTPGFGIALGRNAGVGASFTIFGF